MVRGAQPDVIMEAAPVSLEEYNCSGSCWIGVSTTVVMSSSLYIPADIFVRLTSWPLDRRASVVSSGSQLLVVDGALSVEHIDLVGADPTTLVLSDGGCVAANAGSTLNMTNVSVGNCTTYGNGAILVDGTAHLRDVTAFSCFSLNGGVLAGAGSVVVEDSLLETSGSFFDGGLIYVQGTTTLGGTTTLRSSISYSGNGGAVAVDNGHLVIRDDARITETASQGDGGAVFLGEDASAILEGNAVISAASAYGNGGCIYADVGAIASVRDGARLENCTSEGTGGAVEGAESSVVVFFNGIVSGSSALSGGCIASLGLVLLTGNATLFRCAATLFGGGIYAAPGSTMVELRDAARIVEATSATYAGGVYLGSGRLVMHDDAEIVDCSADDSTGVGGGVMGGDLVYGTSTSVELRDRSRVARSTAGLDGGCISAGTVVLRDHARVESCSTLIGSGGCVSTYTNLTMRDDAVIGYCFSPFFGGCVSAESGHVLLSVNATLADCEAFAGAAIGAISDTAIVFRDRARVTRASSTIYLEGNAVLVTHGSRISRCSATLGGGILAEPNATVALTGTLIDACSATNGGGLYAVGGRVTIGNSTFVDCSASVDGGSLYSDDNASVFVHDAAMLRSYAGLRGGCVHAGSAYIAAVNSTFHMCSSYQGGGIHGQGRTLFNPTSTLSLTDVRVTDCWAESNAGGVYSDATTMLLRGRTVIANCSAAVSGGGVYGTSGALIELSGETRVADSRAGETGGGVFAQSSSRVVLRGRASIATCRAGRGGAAHVQGGSTLTLLNWASLVTCVAESDGGAVLATTSSTVRLLDTTSLLKSTAGGRGGGVHAQDSNVVVRGGVRVAWNSAVGDGGGVSLQGASSTLYTSSACHFYQLALDLTAQESTKLSVLVSTGDLRENEPDVRGHSMLFALTNEDVGRETVYHVCLAVGAAYVLEGYSDDALGWGGATAALNDPDDDDDDDANVFLSLVEGEHEARRAFTVPFEKTAPRPPLIWEHNSAYRGGAVALSESTVAQVDDTTFESNVATSASAKDGGGGAIYVAELATISVTNATFEMDAATDGGAVDAATLSVVEISGTVARGCNASGSGGFARLKGISRATIDDCVLQGNAAVDEGGALAVVDVRDDITVALSNVSFDQNGVRGSGGGLAVRSSNADLQGVAFVANRAKNGGALAMLDTAESSVSFVSGDGCANATIEIDFRFTTAKCSPFDFGSGINTTCDVLAAGCAAYQAFAAFGLDNTSTTGASLVDLVASLGLESFLEGELETGLSNEAELVQFQQSAAAFADACAGCACYIHEERYVSLRDVSLGSEVARVTPRAGALVEYDYCLRQGAYALQAHDTLAESWWNGTYRLILHSRDGASTRVYEGSAVRGRESERLVVVVGDSDVAVPSSVLEYNTANQGGGGAIFIDDGVDDTPPEGIILGLDTNTARYGPRMATPARRLHAVDDKTVVSARSGYAIGDNSTLAVELVDAFDQRATAVNEEATAIAEVRSPPNATISNNVKLFAAGVATFETATITLAPGSRVTVVVNSPFATLQETEEQFFVYLDECRSGTVQEPVSTTTSWCALCDVRKAVSKKKPDYSNSYGTAGMDCSELGLALKFVPVNKRRFRTTATSEKTYMCPSKGSGCPGGNVTGDASCAKGYTGVACGACELRYYPRAGSDGRLRCNRCDKSLRRTTRILLASIGGFVLLCVCCAIATRHGHDIVRWCEFMRPLL
ncbi:hypothetical protein CTAYLR_004158 [Chrysophaeum taylorii]|uniref:Uncharacterized protein n=1 Tax=Chrysophaeum taylorii TaxID=2483200 RepID=A0AAD7XQL3_9STRA|nr:hypothetical protein CTAYLR_004158 [Chrysophaeum taylorii]